MQGGSGFQQFHLTIPFIERQTKLEGARVRVHETYSLDCVCGAAVELPANCDPCCPRCGSALNIQWHGEPVEHPAIEYPDAAADEWALRKIGFFVI